MLPFSILRIWFLGLVALAIIGISGYLFYDWYYRDRDREQLYWAVGVAAVALAGTLMPRLLFGGLSPSVAPNLGPPEARTISGHKNTQLRVNVFNPTLQGTAFVFTHGWSLSSSAWHDTAQHLLKSNQLVLWDLRGLGESSRATDNDYSIEAMAHDLAAVIEHLAPRPVILVGHSIGGMITQTFCRLHPRLLQRVERVVLVDTTYTSPLKTALLSPLWTVLQKPVIEPLLYLTIALSPLVRLMNVSSYWNGSTHWTTRLTSFAGQQTWRQLDLASRLSAFASPAVVARGMLAMLKFDEQGTLLNVRTHVATVAGTNDRLTKPEASRKIAAIAPSSSFVAIEPGGHLSLLERHEAVATSLLDTSDVEPAKAVHV